MHLLRKITVFSKLEDESEGSDGEFSRSEVIHPCFITYLLDSAEPVNAKSEEEAPKKESRMTTNKVGQSCNYRYDLPSSLYPDI